MGPIFYTSANTERIGANRIAVLEKNSVYRMHDILVHSGVRFRRDSVSVLCEPMYRGTLLRNVLATTSLVDGAPLLQHYGPEKLELLLAQRSDGAAAAPEGGDVDRGWAIKKDSQDRGVGTNLGSVHVQPQRMAHHDHHPLPPKKKRSLHTVAR